MDYHKEHAQSLASIRAKIAVNWTPFSYAFLAALFEFNYFYFLTFHRNYTKEERKDIYKMYTMGGEMQ